MTSDPPTIDDLVKFLVKEGGFTIRISREDEGSIFVGLHGRPMLGWEGTTYKGDLHATLATLAAGAAHMVAQNRRRRAKGSAT